jgi:SpoIID/LytB domain protein
MGSLAPSGHGRCSFAPGKVTGPAEEPLLPVPPSRRSHPRPPGHARIARIVLAAVTSLVVALSGLGSVTTARADGTPPLPDFAFYGRGYGHGVGMSQYGARGRALAGQLAPEILAHYYAGTTLGTRSRWTTVRVLLLTGFAASVTKPLTVLGKLGSWTIDGVTTVFPADSRLLLFPTAAGATTWTLRVRAADNTLLYSSVVSSNVWVRPSTYATALQLVSKATTTNVYRGSLRIRLTTTAQVINHIGLDLYLRGVVPLEMPSSWPAEALKVQAIAARSYAVAHLHPATGTYDVYDDTRSQVYRGRRAETTTGNLAVSSTSGVVLLSGSSVANAVFHSSDGGATEDNEKVWTSSTGTIVGSPVSYLRGSSDRAPDGTSYDRSSPYATWTTATYTATELSAMFARDPRTNVGTLTAIDLTDRGPSGRLISITLTGNLGTKTVSGEVFRSVFNTTRPAADPSLRSTLFDTAPIP